MTKPDDALTVTQLGPAGTRIEIPPHHDLWMRGARFGVVVKQTPKYLHVRMDHPAVERIHKIPVADIDYCRIV